MARKRNQLKKYTFHQKKPYQKSQDLISTKCKIQKCSDLSLVKDEKAREEREREREAMFVLIYQALTPTKQSYGHFVNLMQNLLWDWN